MQQHVVCMLCCLCNTFEPCSRDVLELIGDGNLTGAPITPLQWQLMLAPSPRGQGRKAESEGVRECAHSSLRPAWLLSEGMDRCVDSGCPSGHGRADLCCKVCQKLAATLGQPGFSVF